MNSRWNWRLYAAQTPQPDATSDLSVWVGCTQPTANCPTLSGTVHINPPPHTPPTIKVHLFHEVAVRRDANRRRARAPHDEHSMLPSSITLGTAIHRGGVAADCLVAETLASRPEQDQLSHSGEYEFSLPVPPHCREWTWAGAEGDRHKIWFVDLRYRVVATVYDSDGVQLATSRNFCHVLPKTYTPIAPSTTVQQPQPIHGALAFHSAIDRRVAVDIDRPNPAKSTKQQTVRGRSRSTHQRSVLDNTGLFPAWNTTLPNTNMMTAVNNASTYAMTNNVVDNTLSIRIGNNNSAHATAAIPLGDDISLKIKGRERAARGMPVLVWLVEVVELIDGFRSVQLKLTQRHKLNVTEMKCGTRSWSCHAHGPLHPSALVSDVTLGDFVRISHRVDVQVCSEKRRGSESTIPVRLLPPRSNEQVAGTPRTMAVWGSTSRVELAGRSQMREPRGVPAWVRQLTGPDSEESGSSGELCSIDMLRRLAYEKGQTRGRSLLADVKMLPAEDDWMSRFPSIFIDHDCTSEFADRSCPVCLEDLRGGVVTVLPCLHGGHRSCLKRFQMRRSICPVCRLDLRRFPPEATGITGVASGH